MNRPLLFSTCFFVSLLALSCSHRPVRATGIPIDDLEARKGGPILEDPSLKGDLEIGTVQAVRSASGTLRITIPFLNVSGSRLQLLCKVVFKDERGVVLDGDETSYQYISAPVGMTRKSFTSMTTQASRYEIAVRRYKP